VSILYPIASISRAVMHYIFFVDVFISDGIAGFVTALFVNGAATVFTADL